MISVSHRHAPHKRRKTAAGRVGRRRQPHLRRGALALSRPALELTLRALPGTTTARQKDHKDLPSLFLSAHANSRSSASSFYTDITARKTNVVYNNNFSAVSRLLLPCLPRGIPPHFRAARIRVLAGCRQLATTAASAHSLVFLAKCTAFNYRRRKSRVATRQGGVVQRTRETPKAEGTGRVGKKNSSRKGWETEAAAPP